MVYGAYSKRRRREKTGLKLGAHKKACLTLWRVEARFNNYFLSTIVEICSRIRTKPERAAAKGTQ